MSVRRVDKDEICDTLSKPSRQTKKNGTDWLPDAPMHFLNRSETWETVKPYNFQYYLKEDFPRHNLEHSTHSTRLLSMRDADPPVSLDQHGFTFDHISTRMVYTDFADEAKIQSIYCKELEEHLKESLGAKHVRALDYQIRRREAEFPYLGGRLPDKPQPSLLTHVDVTPSAAESIIKEVYPDIHHDILQARYQIVTVWRPLRIPVNDWPLAICDATSIDREDLVASDILYPKFVAENYMLHFNKDQRWFWLPDHESGEVLMFKAVDTGDNTSWPCPHGAFPLKTQDAQPLARESIDARLLVMYADIDYPTAKPWEQS